MRSLAWSVAVVVVVLGCGSAFAGGPLSKEKAKAVDDAGSSIATPVDLGPYRGDLLVWETGLELTVYDQTGKALPPKRVQALATIVRRDGKISDRPGDKTAPFHDRQTHSRAAIDLTGVRELEIKISVVIAGQRHEDTVIWRLIDDRARINDQGLKL
jgi:hypothetical protein